MSTSSIAAANGTHASTPRSEHHVARRRRAGSAMESVALVAIVVLLIAGVAVTSGRGYSASPRTAQVLVERGQSLWTLAAEHPVAGQTTEQTAQLIAQLNGVRDGIVPAGKTIVVPAPATTESVLTASRY